MTGDTRPVWLLDVDGVVNALNPGWGDTARAKCAGLTIRWAPDMVARIRALHASGLVEVRWSTTWCGFPDQLAALGALLDMHFESAFTRRPIPKTWADLKAEAAHMVLAEGRRLVWADDSEVGAARQLYPMVAAAEADGRALLVQPDSRSGLQPEHLDAIEAFVGLCVAPNGGPR